MTQTSPDYSRDPAYRTAQLGIEVDRFISQYDKIGNYLVERAHQCRIAALEKLATVSPTDAEAIAKLQMDAKIPDLFNTWLGEAIVSGQAAEESIKAEESYEG